jgi:hypothetical protein
MRVRGRRRSGLSVVVGALVVVAVTGAGPVVLPSPAAAAPLASSATPPAAEAASAAAVTSAVGAVDAIAADTGVWIGVAVLDRVTGKIAVGAQGATPVAAASLTKLYTVVDVLDRATAGEITLTDADRRWIERALSLSDDNAMNALWSRFGGADTVAGAIESAGLQDSKPPSDPSQWGEALVSARDLVAVYEHVLTGMTDADSDLVIGALTAAADVAADGFRQDFGLLAPPRRPGVAAKQGWMWWGPTFYLHTAGAFGPDERYVVAINSTSRSAKLSRATIDRAAAAAAAALD